MSEESFLLVSLEEDKAKQLAQVLSNDTARKILNFLSKKEYITESELAKELNMPLSTVHYNIQALLKAGLVNDDHYTYSEKGKQITHYTLANKYVIIAPKKTRSLFEKLKRYLPVVAIIGAVTLGIRIFNKPILEASAQAESLQIAADTIDLARSGASASNQEFALWFLTGSIFALILYFVWVEIIINKPLKK